MSIADAPEPASRLFVLAEGELATMRREDGMKVSQRGDRYWGEISRGFYQPINLVARLSSAEVRRPTIACWGYRAALADGDAPSANASMPVHLLRDVGAYNLDMLDRNQTRNLRRCRRDVEIRQSPDVTLMVEQGYEVFMSAQRRTGFYSPHVTVEEHRRRMAQRISDGRRLFVAGLVDGKLGGYLESYAVEGVLYTHELFVATEVMATGIGTGLYVETIEIAARSGEVHEVCLGLHTPERPGITQFKEGLAVPVVRLPSRCVMPGPISALIRARRPASHYRLTGAMPSPV